ncbi:hypothetical protein [Cognatiyoonia sp. IB215182]|uniref:hypothetical protein n=1 Tax=Cognatiyoonia sp. IB215182 TaxID=3097353 RepID=UPI002A0BC34A|nr:hypothetical protein [Cognatiyoonia sp. IB215182]MDX8350890.1 hypothetical protein [Cognatiyoonia sp. IB215182]
MTLTFLVAAQAASADEFAPALEAYLHSNVTAWATDPVILDALRSANSRTADFQSDQILALDQAWRAEVGQSNAPTIEPILNNAAADFLRGQVNASGGTISEIFIMDSVGLNVAASSVTSDMWQGDEAKFTETYSAGPGATHIGDVEFDESAQTYLGQVSMAISDPDTGELLGAVTVGVNAEQLF